ncbi:hypothetical protein DRF65_10930 [Chryseobacterium pennae]|uniref:PIN domain-containing protein n=1 Tax=Chryseobacterium pennae TaxID=2258962 RepID=A0A3D9C8L8_9FLAO|nr:PIN domain-containing protein [Chryseobacterium pennae]REC62220.1 hypothetical protein DRF65_10930 [Chryseobacterium pennae]
MKVILDANIIIADYAMASPSFIILLSSSKNGEIELFIPDLVIDEVLNKYKQRLEKAGSDVSSEIDKFNKLGKTKIASPLTKEIVLATCEAYEARLRRIIEENNIVILDYPETSHRFLARKAMQTKKPFNANEKGYRDCLIWENVKSLVPKENADIVLSPEVGFITANHKDFLFDNIKLHDDLAYELENESLPADSIGVYENLHVFNEVFTKIYLEHASQVEARLRDKEFWELKMGTKIDEFLEEILIGAQLGNWTFDTSNFEDAPTIEEITEVFYDYENLSVKKLAGTEYILDVKADMHLGIEVFIDKHDYYSSNNKDFRILDFDWNDHVLRAWQVVQMPVTLTIMIDNNFDCLAMEINDFAGENE